MKNKILVILPILLATILVMTVSAATTMSLPATGGNYTKSLTVTVLYDGLNSHNMTNVTCYYNATGGATGTQFLQILNTTSYQKTFTDVGSLTIEAKATYNISCKVQNGTTVNTTLYASGIGIDGTAPVIIGFDVKQKSINPNGLIEAKCSYADATTGTTSASYFRYADPAGTAHTLTADGTYQSVKDASTAQEGNYVFSCYAIDYSGNAAAIQTDTTTNTGFTISVTTQSKGIAGIPIWIWLGIAALIYYFATRKK